MNKIKITLLTLLVSFSSISFASSIDFVYGVPFNEKINIEKYHLEKMIGTEDRYSPSEIQEEFIKEVKYKINDQNMVKRVSITFKELETEKGKMFFEELKKGIESKYISGKNPKGHINKSEYFNLILDNGSINIQSKDPVGGKIITIRYNSFELQEFIDKKL